MDHTSFISQVDRALADLIFGCIQNDSTTKAMISNQEQISFSSPKTTPTRGNKKLSIFLYNITQETSLKNLPPFENESRQLKSATSFALHYFVTPFAENEKDDHTLIEKIIQMFLAKPLINITDAESNIEVAVKIDSLSLDELNGLWMALDAPLRLSVSLTVFSASLNNPQAQITDVAVASQTPAFDTNRVAQLYQVVLKTFTEQSTGWRNRNMVVKQWVLQDFQKNSGMTVEEMQNTLNSLGGKLEHHESTDQYIKTLNQLAGYYQHQLDEMKGLHKISHKQTENIETITVWIRDIKSLMEALKR